MRRNYKKLLAFLVSATMLMSANMMAFATEETADLDKGVNEDAQVVEEVSDDVEDVLVDEIVTEDDTDDNEAMESDEMILGAGSSMITAEKVDDREGQISASFVKGDYNHWYKFTTLNEDVYYRFTCGNVNVPGGYLEYEIVDEGGKRVADSNYGIKAGSMKRSTIRLPKNKEYYIHVYTLWREIGEYAFKYVTIPDTPNTKDEAVVLAENEKHREDLYDGDQDWFKITASKEGIIKINIEVKEANIWVEFFVYDNDGKELKKVQHLKTGEVHTMELNVKEGVTYWLKGIARNNVGADRVDGEYIISYNIPKLHLQWMEEDGKAYWYENGDRQGTSSDPKGIMGFDARSGKMINRGREICDPNSNAWYWLDSQYNGAKACNKEVWIPYIYQEEENWSEEEIWANAYASGDMAQQVHDAILLHGKEGAGKWVRYDEKGAMIKGWYYVTGKERDLYPNQAENVYYYDPQTGLMAKGWHTIEGSLFHFDEVTGVLTGNF